MKLKSPVLVPLLCFLLLAIQVTGKAADQSPTPPNGHKGETVFLDQPFHRTLLLSLYGGLAIPSGDLQNYVRTQSGFGTDFFYALNESFSLGAYYNFASLSYKSSVAASPFTSNAFGLKGRLYAIRYQDFAGFLEGGTGLYLINHALAVLDPNNNTVYSAQYMTDAGLGFMVGAGMELHIFEHAGVLGNLSLHSVDLSGGTGDSLLFAVLAGGLFYIF